MLSNWKKKLAREGLPKARQRVGMLNTSDLFNSMDPQLYRVGEALSMWRRGGGQPALDDAYVNILVLLEMLRELESRQHAAPN